MTTDADRERLVEEVTTAHRERVAGRAIASSAWHDLDDDGRREAFEATVVLRRMESAADSESLSTTARAVLARIP